MNKLVCAALAIAASLSAHAAIAVENKPVAVVCKPGGKMAATTRSGAALVLQFAPSLVAAKSTEPADGQCAYRDEAMTSSAPVRLRTRNPKFAGFVTRNLLKGSKFEVQATNTGKGVLIITAITPLAAATQ